ncbi:MAG: holo-ACP synthase [Planctomycetota bacterium]
MIVAVGVDTVAIARIADLLHKSPERFPRRLFTADEIAFCESRPHPAESFAARFCAKEAVMKCLGTGWTAGLAFRQIEVARGPTGAVSIRLSGAAAERAQQLGIRRWHLSLTHDAGAATAFVVAEA